jgi:hypothetical protein
MKQKNRNIIKEQKETPEIKELKKRLQGYIDGGCAPGVLKPTYLNDNNPQTTWAIEQTNNKTRHTRLLFDIKQPDGTTDRIIYMDGKWLQQGWYCPGIDTPYTEKSTHVSQTKTPQQQNAIDSFKKDGWEDRGGILNPNEAPTLNQKQLHDFYPDLFPNGYILVQPISSVDTKEIIDELNNLSKNGNFGDRKTCRNIIRAYNVAKLKEAPVRDSTLENWKIAVNACAKKVANFNDLGITKKILDGLTGDTQNITGDTQNIKGDTENIRWSLTRKPQETPTETNESVLLKKIIRENLIELSNNKKKSLVEEYNVINLRFGVITESGKPKTKKQKEKFVDDIINEIFYLKSQGFNETLINEQFLDIIKSFFGQVPGGIFDTLKERFTQFILEKLGIDTEGYLANIFIATLGNIPIGDYVNGKVFDCQYLSNAISKGVGEGIARKIQKEQGMEGPFYDIIRNAMVDMFTDSSFGGKIENALGQIICPSLPKIKERFNSAGETMKEKALS